MGIIYPSSIDIQQDTVYRYVYYYNYFYPADSGRDTCHLVR